MNFDIEFKPQLAIKVQALANFIAELTPMAWRPVDNDPSKTLEIWKFFVDGALNGSDSKAGVIINYPDKTTKI